MDPSAAAVRLRALIRRAPPRRREVLLAGLRRLAIHPRQHLGRLVYLELCASYLQKCVECAYETARQAWNLMRQAVGWWSVPSATAEGMGARLRPLGDGQRHGQHLLLDPAQLAHLGDLARELGIVQPTPDEHLHWTPVEPMHRGRSLMCRCPFHDDRHPSMMLDTHRRRATCLACGTVHRFDGAAVSGPKTRRPPVAPGAGTREYQRPPGTCVVGCLGRGGLRTWQGPDGVMEALREAEVAARRARVPVLAGHRQASRARVPDLVVFLDEVAPAGWRRRSGRWIPAGHRPVAERALTVDVDDIEIPNVLDAADGAELAAAGARIASWADGVPELSGRVAVVQTSLHGVQVTMELSEPRPPGWRRHSGSAVCDAADQVVLRELEAAGYIGGHADPSARMGGRLIRRPGPRIDKRNQPWISRLRYLNMEDPCCSKPFKSPSVAAA